MLNTVASQPSRYNRSSGGNANALVTGFERHFSIASQIGLSQATFLALKAVRATFGAGVDDEGCLKVGS